MSYHSLPPHVQEILQTLKEAGFLAYVVGGAVRDHILGKTPKDFDIVTNARPSEISKLFAKTLDIGKQFGISMVVTQTPEGSKTTEIATFRADGEYLDARHPEEVVFATPPEDALRILRALRFEAQLADYKFIIEPETLRAIALLCPNLVHVSRERITQEINLIFASSQPSLGFHHLLDLGLWYQWTGLSGRVFGESVLNFIAKDAHPVVYWATALYGLSDEKQLKQALERFVLPRDWCHRIETLLFDKDSLFEAPRLSLADLKHFLQDEPIEDFFCLYQAIAKTYSRDRKWVPLGHAAAFCAEKKAEFLQSNSLNPAPLISGKDLLALGVSAGPGMKHILEQVRKAQLNEEITSRHEAEVLLQKILGKTSAQ